MNATVIGWALGGMALGMFFGFCIGYAMAYDRWQRAFAQARRAVDGLSFYDPPVGPCLDLANPNLVLCPGCDRYVEVEVDPVMPLQAFTPCCAWQADRIADILGGGWNLSEDGVGGKDKPEGYEDNADDAA